MKLKKGLTKPECDRIRELANFNDEEEAVFNLRVKGKSIVELSFALNMSVSTVNNRLKDIRHKINTLAQLEAI